MKSPQIIISLSPLGELVTELPGLNGSRRKINLQEPSNYSLAAENAIECIKAFQNLFTLEAEYNQLASKTTHKGTKEEKEKLLAEMKFKDAKLKIENANSIIASLSSILQSNDTTTGIILKILNSQTASKIQIGEDGNPTASQIKHWENHGILCQDPNCKKNQNGSRPHSHESLWSDPSCPHCKSEGRFEPGFNREDTRKLRGLSEHEALRLGLISRGFMQSKNNPEIWTKKNMGAIFLLPNGKVRDHKQVEWSDGHRKALISDGKIHAKTFGFNPVPPRQGAGKAKKLVKMIEKEPKAKKLIQISATI